MKRTLLFATMVAGLVALTTRAEWISSAQDFAVGAGPAKALTLAAGAGAPVAQTLAAGGAAVTPGIWQISQTAQTVTNYTAAVDSQLLGATVGIYDAGGTLNTVTLSAVTSGVSVVLATFTNGGAKIYSPALPHLLPAGTLLTVKTVGVTTNAHANLLFVRTQAKVTALATIDDDTARLLTRATVGPVLPEGATVTLSAVTSGVSVVLATFTNGAAPWVPDSPIPLGQSNALTLVASGATNLAQVTVTALPTFKRTLTPGPSLLFSAAASAIFPASDTAALTLTATTSGVATVLATFTNGAAPWVPVAPLELLAGDTLTASASGVTNDAPLILSFKPLLSPFVAPTGDLAARVIGVRVFGTPAPGPAGWSVTATLVRQGAAAQALATFTNEAAAYEPSTPVTLYAGDRIILAAAGATNAATVRAMIETQR